MPRFASDARSLVGNPLWYGYTYADEKVARFAEIFSRLRAEAFWNYSVAYRTHDAHLALALARRLYEGRLRGDVSARLEAVRVRVNRLYVDGYRGAFSLAASSGGFADAASLVSALGEPARALETELDANLNSGAPGVFGSLPPISGSRPR